MYSIIAFFTRMKVGVGGCIRALDTGLGFCTLHTTFLREHESIHRRIIRKS